MIYFYFDHSKYNNFRMGVALYVKVYAGLLIELYFFQAAQCSILVL